MRVIATAAAAATVDFAVAWRATSALASLDVATMVATVDFVAWDVPMVGLVAWAATTNACDVPKTDFDFDFDFDFDVAAYDETNPVGDFAAAEPNYPFEQSIWLFSFVFLYYRMRRRKRG